MTLNLIRLLALIVAPISVADNNVPQFRGPSGDGHYASSAVALQWSETSHVKWKTPVTGKAWSSPVVWGKQVWMTNATPDGRELSAVCLDRETGKVLLNRQIFNNPTPEPLGNDINGYGSPTPVIEEGRVYLHFGSPGTVCLDTRTFKTIWTRQDLKCRHYRGPSSSPIPFKNTIILTFDGADFQYIVALDKKTGANVWRTERSADFNDLDAKGMPTAEGDFRKAHSTPLIVDDGGQPLMISVGSKAAYGYDPATGKELWKLPIRGFSASMRPVVGHGLLFITTGFGGADLLALPLHQRGAVTPDKVVWKQSKLVPSKPSPLIVDDLMYLITDSGVLTCLEVKTGQNVWSERVGTRFSASPVYAAGHIFLFGEDGETLVVKPGRALSIVGKNQLEIGCMATPVVSGNSWIIRTRTHVYRID